jgi:hypothetical protein
MSLRHRIVVLASAGLIAAGLTAALAFEPLCSVFRSTRHYARKPAVHSAAPATTATPTSLAAHP